MTDKRAILPNPKPNSASGPAHDVASLFSAYQRPSNGASGMREASYRSAIKLSSIDLVTPHPLDTFWRLAVAEGYDRERISADELHLSVSGTFNEYHISLSWNGAEDRLQLFLLFDGRIYSGRSDQICRLISLVNERLNTGHFDYWENDQTLVYRNSVSLPGTARITSAQAMIMIADAILAADKGYPACQYVLWAGMSPDEAISSALLEQARRSAQN